MMGPNNAHNCHVRMPMAGLSLFGFFQRLSWIVLLLYGVAAIPCVNSHRDERGENAGSFPRRRLNPNEEEPSKKARLSSLLHRLNSYGESQRQRGLTLVDHLNDEAASSTLPSTKNWTIELTAPPVWICQSSKTTESCWEDVKEQQADLIFQLRSLYPSMKVLGQAQRILNTIHVELPFEAEISRSLAGVQHIALQQHYTVQVQEAVEEVGGTFAQEYCLTGSGIKVGILDTGVDYTHLAIGGEGTVEAYVNAYGLNADSIENTQRGAFFPTSTVVDGRDFLGENEEEFAEDEDPIDGSGHGTAVASALLAIAPGVKIVAVKSCTTSTGLCPEFALVQGIEFMMDPNRDGSIDDKVDIINLSLAGVFKRAYHDVVSRSLENAAQLGVVCITAFGNIGNIPYIAGAFSATPNVIAVGATNTLRDNDSSSGYYMADYSSRGPGEANLLKPDLSAPGNLLLAASGTGDSHVQQRGTSFSVPLVAGAAALLRQHCPGCDPLAIKCLLMNSADRDIRYSGSEGESRMAPVTRMGSGLLRVDKALNATLWAFSLEERQPSLSFGTVNCYQDIIFTKTIEINAIDSRARTLTLGYEFRNASKADVVIVSFVPDVIEMTPDCGSTVTVQVRFFVNAEQAPPNTMTTSGYAGVDPRGLDRHEFDGHILISSDIDQEVSLPFHMLVRQAASPRLKDGSALPSEWGPLDKNVTIINDGFGVAQIDAFELIYSDDDVQEFSYGVAQVYADIRTIGYRTIPVGEPACDYSVEFSFQTWERVTHVSHQQFQAEIYPDGPSGDFLTFFIPMFPTPSQSYVLYNGTNTTLCTGLPSDHSSNTANTIMRACSNDLLLNDPSNFTVQFRSFAYPLEISTSFLSPQMDLTFPNPRLSAPSYDIGGMETLTHFHVTGEISPESYGLQLVTNSFRTSDHTGASTRPTETILLTKQGIRLEPELTPDFIIWPGLFNQTGPPCGLALPSESICQATTAVIGRTNPQQQTPTEVTAAPDCPPVEVPRLDVPTPAPSGAPSSLPTAPTASPTRRPTPNPVQESTPAPVVLPTLAPISSGDTHLKGDFGYKYLCCSLLLSLPWWMMF